MKKLIVILMGLTVLTGLSLLSLFGCTSSRGDVGQVTILPCPAPKPLPYNATVYVPTPTPVVVQQQPLQSQPQVVYVATPTPVVVHQPVYQPVYQPVCVRQVGAGGVVYTTTWQPCWYAPQTYYYNTSRTWTVGGSWSFGGGSGYRQHEDARPTHVHVEKSSPPNRPHSH